MRKKIFKSMCLTALLTILLSSLLITVVYYGDFESRMKSEVRAETDYIKSAVELSGAGYLSGLPDSQNRVTLIDETGRVLYDSYADPSTMENHRDRPEVQKPRPAVRAKIPARPTHSQNRPSTMR